MDFVEWTEQIWEYGQEHWIVLLTAAVVLLVLLACILTVRAARRSNRENVPEQATPTEPEPVPEPKNMLEQECIPEAENQATPEPKQETQDGAEAQGLMQNLLRSAEEASRTTGKKVESIELKIEKAQLTIHYTGGKKETVSEENVESERMESSQDADSAERPETGEGLEIPKRNVGWKEKEGPKKFGADNMNKTRSGRVYSEEELREQIKD